MSLIHCLECGEIIETTVEKCPNCWFPYGKFKEEASANGIDILSADFIKIYGVDEKTIKEQTALIEKNVETQNQSQAYDEGKEPEKTQTIQENINDEELYESEKKNFVTAVYIDAKEIKVDFIGKEYTFPIELRRYVGYLQEFSQYYLEAMNPLLDQMQKRKFSGPADEDFAYYKKPLSQIVEKIIKRLAQEGVYDITFSDLLDNNTGYQRMKQICSETFEASKQISIDALNNFMSEAQSAYSSAASNITGSGVSIWTSSISSALLYSAMESSVIKSQAQRADTEYKKAIADINERNTSESQRKKTKLLVEKYYPEMSEAIKLFSDILFEKFLDTLNSANLFELSSVASFDSKRASEILKNIDFIDDKRRVIEQAFIYCPYDIAIYEAVIKHDLINAHVIETANVFGLGTAVAEMVENYCHLKRENILQNEDILQSLAIYKKCPVRIFYKDIYEPEIKLLNEISNGEYIVQWIKSNISMDTNAFLKCTDEDISDTVKSYIEKIGNDLVARLVRVGAILVNGLSIKDAQSSLNKDICDKIFSNTMGYINTYRKKMILHRAELQTEIDRISGEYKNKKTAYDEKIKRIDLELEEIKQRRAQEKSVLHFMSRKSRREDMADEAREGELMSEKYSYDIEKSDIQNLENQLKELKKAQEGWLTY